MKIVKLDREWQIKRPYQAFEHGAIALLLVSCTLLPFSDVISRHPLNLFFAFAYSLYLPFVTIGLLLLPPIVRARFVAALFLFPLIGSVFSAGIVLLARVGQLVVIHSIILPVIWVTGAFSLIVFFVAGGGWYFYRASNSPVLSPE